MSKFDTLTPEAITQALAERGSVIAAAEFLGVNSPMMYKLMRRYSIPLPPRVPYQPKPAPAVEHHPPTVPLLAEMESLRAQVRTLLRRPGPRGTTELLALEARHRILHDQLRTAMGEGETARGISGHGPRGTLRGNWDPSVY